ncbi:MAG: alpha/beta hydrolase family protein [Planctomycetota bacterium]|jgi:pimeloyl-ACP methyl ester carboxylesterase
MARQQDFAVELEGTSVHGRLDLPEPHQEQRPFPTVLLCHGLPSLSPGARRLHGQLTDALVEAGLVVASIAEGSAGSPGTRLAVESVDDAAAVFHGLAVREELDLDHIGVLGHSLGAIVAACLAKRTDQIDRLCLLAPVTADHVAGRLAVESAADLTARLGGGSVPPGFFDGLEALTPEEDVAAYDRPTLILHGAADSAVPPASSARYRDAILAAGHRVAHMRVAMGDRDLSNETARAACLDQIVRFFAAAPKTQSAASRS